MARRERLLAKEKKLYNIQLPIGKIN